MKLFRKVGVTGTKAGSTHIQSQVLYDLLRNLDADELHQGDCIGVDAEAATFAKALGMKVISHPPLNPKYRAWAPYDEQRPLADYFIRNERIVNESDVLIGIPKGPYEELRSGTWACIRYARKVGRLIHIIYPNGRIKIEGS